MNVTDAITMEIILDAMQAEASLKILASKIQNVAKITKISAQEIKKSLVEAYAVSYNVSESGNISRSVDAEIKNKISDATRLAEAWEKVALAKRKADVGGVSQIQAVSVVDDTNAMYDARLKREAELNKSAQLRAQNFGRELEEVNRVSKALREQEAAQVALNTRLTNGTASVSEYATALKTQLSPALQQSLLSIDPLQSKKMWGDNIQVVKQGLQEISKLYNLNVNKAGSVMKEMFPNINPQEIDAATKSLTGMGKALLTIENFARTAFGTLTAIGIFTLITTIQKFFQTSLENAKKYRDELIQLNFAEAILSKKGMDITRAELDSFVSDIQTKFKYMTKLQATSVVSDVASSVSEWNLTKTQMEQLAQSVAFIQLKAQLMGEGMVEAGHIINAAMDARSNFFNKYDVNISEAIVKEYAYRNGLAEVGAELDKNTRTMAIVGVLTEQTTAKTDELNKALDGTQLGMELIAKQDWESATTSFGNFLQTLLAGLQSLYITIRNRILPAITEVGKTLQNWKPPQWLQDNPFFQANMGVLKNLPDTLIPGFAGWRQLYEEGKKYQVKPSETPTGDMIGGDAISDEISGEADTIAKAIDDAKKQIDDALVDFEFDTKEAEIDFNIKMEDIGIKTAQKLEDAQIDYNQKVSEINSDARQKQAEANQKSRDDELKAERDFQEKLLQLKERFLMDLDEALHARDARQILRLIKQYNLEKAQMLREEANRKKETSSKLAEERSAIETDRQQRLQEAQRERDQKIADIRLQAKREQDEARLDYQRKLDDLRRHLDFKLSEIGRKNALEYKLTMEQAKRVYDGLYAYYGKGGYLEQLFLYYSAMKQQALLQGGTIATGTPIPSQSGGAGGIDVGGLQGGRQGGFGFAEGGTIFANRPTKLVFGERGMEMARITPLGRTGRDVNKLFSSMSGDGGVGGNLRLRIALSDGLIAEIVDTSLMNVSSVIETAVRERR